MKPIAYIAPLLTFGAWVMGVMMGRSYERGERERVQVATPPDVVARTSTASCPDVLEWELATGASVMRVSMSSAGFSVVSDPGTGRRMLMLPVKQRSEK